MQGMMPTGRRRPPARAVGFAALLVLVFAVRLQTADTDGRTRGPLSDPVLPLQRPAPRRPLPALDGGCPLCREDPGVPIVPLTAAAADSLGRLYSGFNQALLARVDSLLRAGSLGSPGNREARAAAHLLARLLAVTSMHYMVGFATDPERIHEASEATLRDAFRRFSEPGVYPITRLVRARMGLGRTCVKYDLGTDLDSTAVVGGRTLRVRVASTELNGRPQRMLVLELPTILFSVVELLIAEHFTCRAEFVRSSGPPAPYDLYLLHDIDGMYIRKWGTHKPTAIMFWSTPRDVKRAGLPRTPLVGNGVYVPQLSLELPSLLPDLGFDDLRLVDLPQPILSLSYLQQQRYPEWLERAEPRGFKSWESHGPIPPDLRLRFPDL
jgi:hypothetical protein